jgi:hypothetical protein
LPADFALFAQGQIERLLDDLLVDHPRRRMTALEQALVQLKA